MQGENKLHEKKEPKSIFLTKFNIKFPTLRRYYLHPWNFVKRLKSSHCEIEMCIETRALIKLERI